MARTQSQRERDTAYFLQHDFPAMVTASPADAEAAYLDFKGRIDWVTGDASNQAGTDFDWATAYDIVDEHHRDDGERRLVIARTAAGTAVIDARGREVRLHGDEGIFLTVAGGSGQLVMAHSVPNPRVNPEYGSGDPYAAAKVAEAVYVERMVRQGADWGEGYLELTALKRRNGPLGPDDFPHLGMATRHRIAWSDETRGTDRQAVLYTGATHRTLSNTGRQHVVANHPVLASHMVGEQPNADDLAGWLDSASASVVNRAVDEGIGDQTHIVELPDPLHIDNAFVNFN